MIKIIKDHTEIPIIKGFAQKIKFVVVSHYESNQHIQIRTSGLRLFTAIESKHGDVWELDEDQTLYNG